MSEIQSKLDELESRVDQLEEQQTVQDDDGRETSIAGLMDMGLSRRQALYALGLVAAGASLPGAAMKAVGVVEGQNNNTLTGVEQIGTSSDPVKQIYTDTLTSSGSSIATQLIELDQQANNGNDRFVVKRADGTEMAEIYSDGTNTVLNPISGNLDITGAVSTDELNSEDLTAANSGDVLKVGSSPPKLTSGSIETQWKEDANSPLTISSATSGTITLDGTYDMVECFFTGGSGNQTVAMQVNGDTGQNYDYYTIDGSNSTGAENWRNLASHAGNIPGYQLQISGVWESICQARGPTAYEFGSGLLVGRNENVSSPLDSITLLQPFDNNITVTMEVWGRDGP